MISYSPKTPSYEHQDHVFAHICETDHPAILSEQGTGKTKSVIDFMDYYRENVNEDARFLIVAPNAVVSVWAKELQEHSKHYSVDNGNVFIMNVPKKRRVAVLQSGKPGAYIINYEGVRALDVGSDTKGLHTYDFDIVVADEMTKIKHASSKQSKAMAKFPLSEHRAKRIGITGTPVAQSPLDIFGQYRFLDPRVFGSNFFRFRARYGVVGERYGAGGRRFKEVVDYQNLEELRERMHSIAVRFTKDQCLDLPDRIEQQYELDWPPGWRKVYDEMVKEMIALVDGSVIPADNAMTKIVKARQLCNGWVYDENHVTKVLPGPNPKLDAVAEIVDDADGPVLIWATYRQDIENISKALEKCPGDFGVISGDVPSEERARVVEAFQNGEIKAAVVQQSIGQYGLTMTASNTVVYFSEDWSVENKLQSMDRVHRIGQTRKVRYITLSMKDSVDVSIHEALKKKRKLSNNLTKAEFEQILKGRFDGGGSAD